jgi:hypothetical protein
VIASMNPAPCLGELARGATPYPLPAPALSALLERLQRLIDAEAAGLLAGWEFLEGAKEFANELLRRDHNKQVFNTPALVVHSFMVRGLEGIASQIEQLRQPQRDEGLLPDIEAVRALFREHNLPLVISDKGPRASPRRTT